MARRDKAVRSPVLVCRCEKLSLVFLSESGGEFRGTKFAERRETIEMKVKGRLSYIRLLVPFLLFAGAQTFAQTAADSRMPAADPAAHQITPFAGVLLISDRTFIMKSIERIAMEQSFDSQSAGAVAHPISAVAGCSSSASSIRGARSFVRGGCPFIDCAAPPPGCSYQNPTFDKNGCLTSCGHLVCGPGGP